MAPSLPWCHLAGIQRKKVEEPTGESLMCHRSHWTCYHSQISVTRKRGETPVSSIRLSALDKYLAKTKGSQNNTYSYHRQCPLILFCFVLFHSIPFSFFFEMPASQLTCSAKQSTVEKALSWRLSAFVQRGSWLHSSSSSVSSECTCRTPPVRHTAGVQ